MDLQISKVRCVNYAHYPKSGHIYVLRFFDGSELHNSFYFNDLCEVKNQEFHTAHREDNIDCATRTQ